jgi:ABC-type multidrug transport system fused ATPase/permease subunit
LPDRQTRLYALQRQHERLDNRLARLQRTSEQFTNLRIGTFFGGFVAATVLTVIAGPLPGALLGLLTIFAFTGVVMSHRRITQAIERFTIWRNIKRTHLARMQLDWDKLPAPPTRQPQPGHPYETDLGISGQHSLHHLIDTAISLEGSQRMIDWLLAPRPDASTIADRQALLGELIPLVPFRDKLTLNARLASQTTRRWRGQTLLDWLEQQDSGPSLKPLLRIVWGLAAIDALLFMLFLFGILPPLFLVPFIIYAFLTITRNQSADEIFGQAKSLEDLVNRLLPVIGYLENFNYEGKPYLRETCTALLEGEKRPSEHLQRLAGIVTAAGVQFNPILAILLNIIMPWNLHFAERLRVMRGDLQEHLPGWLAAWYEVEAASAFATFAYLNPHYVFPDIQSEPDEPFTFQGQAFGHPLIPHQEKVRNDFSIERPGTVVIITGSNMSGKSSFLRTLGMNLALAYAGSVVDAQAFAVGLFRMFTCIQVTDSLTDGISYFYAEVKRLKALLEALQAEDEMPLFFLIDEIFRGTNNRERLIGSRSYIRSLASESGFGLISTHDLELIQLADESPYIDNMHFREQVEGDRMAFDYKLRPGPCPTTNALRIMELEGLPVETPQPEPGD